MRPTKAYMVTCKTVIEQKYIKMWILLKYKFINTSTFLISPLCPILHCLLTTFSYKSGIYPLLQPGLWDIDNVIKFHACVSVVKKKKTKTQGTRKHYVQYIWVSKKENKRCAGTISNMEKIHKVLALPHLEDCVQCSPPYLKNDIRNSSWEAGNQNS